MRRMLSPAECWRCSAVSALSWLSAWAATSSGRPLESVGMTPARVALCWSATDALEAVAAALLEAAAAGVLEAAAPVVEAVAPGVLGCSECPALGSGAWFGTAVLWPFPLASTLLQASAAPARCCSAALQWEHLQRWPLRVQQPPAE